MPEPSDLTDDTLTQAVISLRQQADAIEGQWIAAVAEFDRRKLWESAGAPSAAAWLRHECRIDTPAAKTVVAVAGALRSLPVTAAAFAAGKVGYGHARVIAPAAESTRARDVDPIFARAAGWMRPSQVRNVIHTWTRIEAERRA